MSKAPNGKPNLDAVIVRTEGQRLLLEVPGTLAAIGKKIGGVKTPQSVLNWRTGVSIPGPEARARIQAAFSIPVIAWARLPTNQLAEDSDDDADGGEETELPSSLGGVESLLRSIQRDRNQKGLLPGDRTKLVAAEARILKLRADLEMRAELSEDRYVREHPAWLRVRNELARVLGAFPEAARAVADALERMRM